MNMRPTPASRGQFVRGFPTITPNLRERIEAAIESLLALLDTIDADADLEPSLGAPEVGLPDVIGFVPNRFRSTSQERWSDGLGEEEQEEQHDAEDDAAERGVTNCDTLAQQSPSAFHGRAT
jgi:hypothetical protein